MNPLPKIFKWEPEDRELLLSTSRKVMLTTGGVYLVFHFVATLGFPSIFSPSLYTCTTLAALVLLLALNLLDRSFAAAQAAWFAGLTGCILVAYSLYGRPETLLLLAILPMMAEVMLGMRSTLLVEALLVGLVLLWPRISFLHPLPAGYSATLILSSLATTFLGWGLSDNLISAIETSSYHYREALKRLEETRQHRAEISVLLNEVSKANYQLDRLNKMLGYARARAEEAREDRDRFAMAVSHELRSPLNFVIGFSDLMVNSPETYAPLEDWPPGLYDDIQEVYRSSNHLLSLINDILDMGKMDARLMPLFKERVLLSRIVEEVREMTLAQAEKKGLYLKVELPPDLPILYIDQTRVRQVLLNLVTNSLRFTASGGITIHAAMNGDSQVRVEVQDTGTGIPEEDLEKIFSEFRQVGGQNWRRGEGTGLGLSIGRRFIQLHGGEMGVTSRLGEGSTFFFTLPLESGGVLELTGEDGYVEMAPPSRSSGAEASPLLLVLSTDTFWAKTFAESLNGFKCTLLSDPGQLAAVTRQFYPRAVIVDQAVLDDPAVQSFIVEPPYDVPVICFAIPVNLNRVTALPEGVRTYLLKPVSRHKLVETVRSLQPAPRRILVVDDDPGMVRFVTQSLRSAGEDGGEPWPEPELLTALDGTQALQALHNEAVDAVLLDLDLPDINGLTIIEQMQQDERLRCIPVIILSANDLPQSLSTGQRGLFRVTVNRPFSRKELVDVLGVVLNSVDPDYGDESNGSNGSKPAGEEPLAVEPDQTAEE